MSRTWCVFVPEVEDESSLRMLEESMEVRRGRVDRAYTEEELCREVVDADALLLTSRDRVTKKVLEAARRLKIIGKYGVGVDSIDLDAASEKGIIVTVTPGANADSVAEHTIALMLALCKKLIPSFERVKEGGWKDLDLKAMELKGKCVGIIGLGVIGGKVAEKLKGFRVHLLATDPYISKDSIEKLDAELLPLNELLHRSDIVTIHVPLTVETKAIIGECELRRMKNTAILINTSRGKVVNENALYCALKEGWINGAGFDVFESEPLPKNHPFTTLDNVILTPHFASWTCESLKTEAFMAAEQILKVFLGETPDHVVNPEVLKKDKRQV